MELKVWVGRKFTKTSKLPPNPGYFYSAFSLLMGSVVEVIRVKKRSELVESVEVKVIKSQHFQPGLILNIPHEYLTSEYFDILCEH